MPLTPADVHNVAFKKPSIGKRGYDEDEVDAFLDVVEAELARLIEENADLKGKADQVAGGHTVPLTKPAAPAEAASMSTGEAHTAAARLLGLAQETADKLGITKISELSKFDQDLTLYGTPECRQRLDCLLGLQQVYGLDFKKFVPVSIDLRHEVLTSGKADLSIVFTTDPQIQREGFVLLDDDKQMFPPYNVTFNVRQEVADEAGPEIEKVVDQLQEGLTDEVMSELNARVDLDKKTPEEVAKEYLQESGLI